jgi:hypothetical protein
LVAVLGMPRADIFVPGGQVEAKRGIVVHFAPDVVADGIDDA